MASVIICRKPMQTLSTTNNEEPKRRADGNIVRWPKVVGVSSVRYYRWVYDCCRFHVRRIARRAEDRSSSGRRWLSAHSEHNRTTSGHSPLSDTPMWSRAGDTSVDSVTRVVRRVLMRRTSAQRTVIVGHLAMGRTSVSLVITNGWRTPNPIQPNICVPRKGRHTGSQRTSPHSPQNNISETLFPVFSD